MHSESLANRYHGSLLPIWPLYNHWSILTQGLQIMINFCHISNILPNSRKLFFKGKPPACQLMYGRCVVCPGGGGTLAGPLGGTLAGLSRGVDFHIHFWGGPLPCSFPGGSTSIFTSVFISGGVPCDLSRHVLTYCYRTPQCIMGKIHMDPPPELDRLTDKHE